jgi:hypothetical protein
MLHLLVKISRTVRLTVCLQHRLLFLLLRVRFHRLQDLCPHRPLEPLDSLLCRLRLTVQTILQARFYKP